MKKNGGGGRIRKTRLSAGARKRLLTDPMLDHLLLKDLLGGKRGIGKTRLCGRRGIIISRSAGPADWSVSMLIAGPMPCPQA